MMSRCQFETIARMPEQDQQLVRGVLDALIFKNQARAMTRVTESEKQLARKARKDSKKG
ncbi:hypothetical protein [Caballeronia sp. GAWG2-1]|uniref:hypothetical protein n=1 Tax=Caballeronia sp. GAWG2-1 TaxID=2921744 RepID=UPI002027D0E2|nr:hypothetical protein [Caballeronia sp. GAWG2-1]